MFKGRKLIIATKHQKEEVIAPVLEKSIGVNCFITDNFDTDIFGTFTGEKEPIFDALSTARKKCLTAMEMYGCDLGIASEGSFGAHPYAHYAAADDEVLIFIDKKNGFEIFTRELSLLTNFNSATIKNNEDLFEFAAKASFPTHGLILRKSEKDYDEMQKGIMDWDVLKTTFNHLFNKYGEVYVETDMRALYNPSRMLVIAKATEKLIAKINSHCPNCQTPGFSATNTVLGLPCSLCENPTQSVLSYVYSCQKCLYTKEEKYPKKKEFEEPIYCDVCNA
jgi:hypothetical protein